MVEKKSRVHVTEAKRSERMDKDDRMRREGEQRSDDKEVTMISTKPLATPLEI